MLRLDITIIRCVTSKKRYRCVSMLIIGAVCSCTAAFAALDSIESETADDSKNQGHIRAAPARNRSAFDFAVCKGGIDGERLFCSSEYQKSTLGQQNLYYLYSINWRLISVIKGESVGEHYFYLERQRGVR